MPEKAQFNLVVYISKAQKLRNYPFDGKTFSIPSVLHIIPFVTFESFKCHF